MPKSATDIAEAQFDQRVLFIETNDAAHTSQGDARGSGFEVGQVTSVCGHVRCWNHTFGLGKVQGPHGCCATASTARLWLREGKLRVDQAEQTQQNQQTQSTREKV